MAKLNGNNMFDSTHVMGIVSEVSYDENDDPKTMEVSIELLKDALKIAELMDVDSVYLTVIGPEFPLILKIREDEKMAIAVTPRLS